MRPVEHHKFRTVSEAWASYEKEALDEEPADEVPVHAANWSAGAFVALELVRQRIILGETPEGAINVVTAEFEEHINRKCLPVMREAGMDAEPITTE